MTGSPPVMLITGASSGIGAATARAAVARAYRVVLAARSSERLDQLADELGGAEHALVARCDVREFGEQERMVAKALDAFGRIDVVFANAGVGLARGLRNEPPERWREVVLTNVLGVAYTVRSTMAALHDARGHLVLTGSLAARRGQPGSLYAATKGAVRLLADGARMELEGTGVRVTLLEPGTVDTDFYDNPQADALSSDDVAAAVLHAVGLPRSIDMPELAVRAAAEQDR